MKCGEKTEIYSRVCGYHRPVANWNKGKREEFKERAKFKLPETQNETSQNLGSDAPECKTPCH